MKKLFGVLAASLLLLGTFSPLVSAVHTSSSQWQPVIHNNDLGFNATYQNGAVQMSWNHFVPTQSSWKYWKVVRSTSLQQPYYPDHGYIKAIGDNNTTSYTDTNPPAGTVYYGVCAITASSAGKWRNCDWKAVDISGDSGGTVATDGGAGTTTSTAAPVLSDGMKVAIDALVEKFKNKLSEKFVDDTAGKKAFLAALIPVIDNVINTSSDGNKPMFQYLREKIVEYQGIVELESLLNVE